MFMQYVCLYSSMHVHVSQVRICARMHACTHVCNVCMYVGRFTIFLCLELIGITEGGDMYVYVYEYIYIYVYIYIYIYIHIHIYICV